MATADESPARAWIDGVPCSFEDGETLLTFVRRHRGTAAVPTLCDVPNLKPFGSCRLCSVEIARDPQGPRKVVAACHTPVEAGLHVHPGSERIDRLRRNILELVLTDHPLECPTCEVNGNCELQDAAAQLGVRQVRYPVRKHHLDRTPDRSHPQLTLDLAKCISCYRCVRACDEVQGQFALTMTGRGFDNRISAGPTGRFADTSCTVCGACVQACPTSAISDVFESKSAAVQERIRTTCTYCGVGCNLEVGVRDGRIHSIRAPYDAEVNPGHTCVKGRYAFRFYDHPDRLRSPLVRDGSGALREASWEEAYDRIVERLGAIRSAYGPDAIAGISSSRCTNEENYLMQKFMRAVIGTNNIDGCARVCHAPTAAGMQRAFGTGAATNSIGEIDRTGCMLVIGANPTSAHPVIGAEIKQQALRGTPLIVIDPYRTELARHARHHLQLRPGTNVAVLNMLARAVLEEHLEDRAFIEARCENFDELERELWRLDPAALEAVSGVPQSLAREAARLYAEAPAAMAFHGLGVSEHYQGTRAVMGLANLVMLTGNIGRPGTGMNPLRGQNNVQGAADMGVQPHQGAGYLDITEPEVRAHYESAYGVPVPGTPGLKIAEMFRGASRGDVKAMWIIGEDVAQTDPNSDRVARDLQSLEFLVVQDLFPCETARYASVVLPAASAFEKYGTFTNGERRVQRVNRVVQPLPGTKPDGQILTEVMNRFGYPQPDYRADRTLAEIASVVPFFEGIRWERLGENGKQWPVAADGTDTRVLHRDSFKRGKGRFHFFDFEETAELEQNRAEFPYILTTVRDLRHYNSGTMTRRTANLRLVDRDWLALHPADAHAAGIGDGDRVKVRSARGVVELSAYITDDVKPGMLRTSFHFPESSVNRITSDVLDSESLCPEYKVVAVRIERA